MANPFSVFRRNQKLMLAIVTIGAMFAFVFLQPLVQYMGQRAAPENPVVVETEYGPFKQADLYGLIDSRRVADAFLRKVTAATVDKAALKGQVDSRDRNQIAFRLYMDWRQRLMNPSKPGAEQGAIETMVLARRAQEQGIVVDEAAINDLIRQITGDLLSREEILGVIQSLRTGASLEWRGCSTPCAPRCWPRNIANCSSRASPISRRPSGSSTTCG